MIDVIVGPSRIHGSGVFARRDFAPGETVLVIDDSRIVDDQQPLSAQRGEYAHHCDYLINCHGGDVWTCRCAVATCRGVIPSSYFELPLADQHRLLPLLDSWFVAEHQARINALLRQR